MRQGPRSTPFTSRALRAAHEEVNSHTRQDLATGDAIWSGVPLGGRRPMTLSLSWLFIRSYITAMLGGTLLSDLHLSTVPKLILKPLPSPRQNVSMSSTRERTLIAQIAPS